VLKLDKNIYPIQINKRKILNIMAVIVYVVSAFLITIVFLTIFKVPFLDALIVAVIVSIMVFIIAGAIGFYDYLYVKSIEYYLDENNLVLKGGVISRFEKVLPYSRIQHVIIQESFWQRILGLASVSIETARETRIYVGYREYRTVEKSPTIPDLNLEDAKKLRDKISYISGKMYKPIAGV
jgi:uncharacterized membrane protein YdbT with pleckstrin-like domain